MKISTLPKRYCLWAKSDQGKQSGAWHPLICHLLDVAASCLEILELEPPTYRALLTRDTALTSEAEAVAVIAALVGLHDIGKANPGFQRKNDSCAKRVEEAGYSLKSPIEEVPHGIVSQAILTDLLKNELGVGGKAAKLIADALGAHHGFRSRSKCFTEAKRRQKRLSPLWLDSQRELFHEVWDALGAPKPWTLEQLTPGAFQRLMGLTSVADWIGSSLDFHPYNGDSVGYLREARERAAARLKQLGWERREPLTRKQAFAEIFPFSPRPLQSAVAELAEEVEEPVLLLVEAPMGEGKTEASFFAHTSLQRQLRHRGCYVGLPSQATGNAMFERLKDFLCSQGRKTPPDLQLLHGAAVLSDSYQKLQYQSNTESEKDQKDAVTARRYFTHLKRALLSEYGAGTIDQALLGVLPVKHQFVRLWGLGNRTLVLDEVHAYDTYTGELLNTLLAWMKVLGSSVILMSATLPQAAKEQMLRAYGADSSQTTVEPYPRVTRVHQGEVTSRTFATRPLAKFSLRSAPVEVSALAEITLELVSEGGCLACIVNTVDRAQKLYQRLQGRGVDVQLFHARFPIQKKQQLEADILNLYGKGPEDRPNPERPARSILVATQVVEQSLDLDFDVMVTDLAPVDLIIQRAGRLHRHEKNNGRRATHESPTVLVSGLAEDDITEAWSGTYWEKVYSANVLVRSWLLLRDRETVDLNVDLDPLVQTVYDPGQQLPDQSRFEEFLERARARDRAEGLADQREAIQSTIGVPSDDSWQKAADERLPDEEDTIQYVTRKTEPTVTVVCVYRTPNGLFLEPYEETPLQLAEALSLEDAKAVFGQTVKISRKGLVQTVLDECRSPWEKTPLLRDVHILQLRDGRTEIGGTEIELSPELGLVYRKVPKS